jgi:hypothetical protein
VLVQPATVDRWRRDGFGRCWRRRSGRAGRPRIDSPSRDLIRRLAAENHLWGAPRIHGELLKLGIAVSQRTVSRYLQGRPKARSQTWRTFFANHLSDLAFMPPVASSVATDDDVVVDASGLLFRPVPLSFDNLCAAYQLGVVDWSRSRRPTFLGAGLAQDRVHDRSGARNRTGRDPPRQLRLRLASRRAGRRFSSMSTSDLCGRQTRMKPFARRSQLRPRKSGFFVCAMESSTSPDADTTVLGGRSAHVRH